MLVRDSRKFTGRFLIDEEVPAEAGVSDLEGYAVDPGRPCSLIRPWASPPGGRSAPAPGTRT